MCNRETFSEGNPFRPFCSERCKLIDLDNWLAGRYRLSRPPRTGEVGESVPGDEEAVDRHAE